ncbi:MAG: hypothetical protein AAF602_11170, partial [Myxococcota bacterium]
MRILGLGVVLTACSAEELSADSFSGAEATGRPAEASVETLLDALSAAGVAADEGKLRWDLDQGCCARGDCRLANPGSAYGFPALPPGDDEYVDDRFPDDDGTIAAWRLRPDEGVLYVGPTPPGATYTSFRSYVHDRAAPDGSRPLAAISLGDTLNTAVAPDNDDGTRIVLTTGHQDLADAVV